MKSIENPYLKAQIEITKTLLDGSKKNQNQIAEETDYEKSTISHALDDLEKRNIIQREETKKEGGNRNRGIYTNKMCWLNYDDGSELLLFFENILKLKRLKQQEVDDIIVMLQKSDKFLNIILEKHPNFSSPGNEIRKKPANVAARIQEEGDDFKKKLKASKTFFKICVMNDSLNILSIFNYMYWSFIIEYVIDEVSELKEGCDMKTIMDGCNRAPPLRLRNIGYKVCLYADILNRDFLNKSPDDSAKL